MNSAAGNDPERIAIADGTRTFTYRSMYREWERYASVFAALGMTGVNRSRVGILGSTGAEAVFSIYGLNRVGATVSLIPAYSALTPSRVFQTIRDENLTDVIVTDDFAQPGFIQPLLLRKKILDLHNIIVLHLPVTGVTVDPMMSAAQEAKYFLLKSWYGLLRMDELLVTYGNRTIDQATKPSDDMAFILHTSGTMSGAGKPVVLSDEAFNAAAAGFHTMEELKLPWGDLVTAAIVDMSNAYSMIDQIHS